MQNMDFNQAFNAEEFENFGCDVVAVRENLNIERFKKFKDRGFDGRYIDDDVRIMIQCKRISDEEDLYKKLKNIEIMKVRKFCPDRYILVLSIDLTIGKKDEILALFGDYIKNENDLIMPEDIKGYFRTDCKYDYLRKRYYSLFLAKNVDLLDLLEGIYNPNVMNRTKLLLEDVERLQKYFVSTKVYEESRKRILNEKVICLTGDPGSGKTTSGKMLVDYLLKNGYVDSVFSVKTVEEVVSVYDSSKRQVFFFDDFWGSTFSFLQYSDNDDRGIDNIIERIRTSDSYMIMTTREYVLTQGMRYYKEFSTSAFDKRVFYRNCDYSDAEKIRILYSRLKNSELSYNVLNHLRYNAKSIILYKNYSPRVVDYFVSKNQDTFVDGREFFKDFRLFLRNPSDYLNQIFIKLSEGARIVAYILAISDSNMQVNYLKINFQKFVKKLDGKEVKASKFLDYLKELLNWFVDLDIEGKIVNFSNYSIHDFVNKKFMEEFIDYEEAFVEGIMFFNQFYNLIFDENDFVTKESKKRLVERFVENFNDLVITYDEEIDGYLKYHPVYYLYHKLWKTLDIYENYRDEELKKVIIKAVDEMFENEYAYLSNNLINIPEIVQKSEECGIYFNKEKIICDYFNCCEEFVDYVYMSLFPKSYYEIIRRVAGYDKNELLSYMLDELDYCGKEFSNYVVKTLFPKFLDIIDVKIPKKIENKIKKYEALNTYNLADENDDIYENFDKEKNIDDVIEECEGEKYDHKDEEEDGFLEILEYSSLSEKNKRKMVQKYNASEGVFSFLYSSEKEFYEFLLSFYEKKESAEEKINLDISVYEELFVYLENESIYYNEYFLIKYAFDSIEDNFNYYSFGNILKKYEVSRETLEELIDKGVLIKLENLVMFSDTLFQIYLSVLYIKQIGSETIYGRDKNQYIGICDSIQDLYIINEKFNTIPFNCYFICPTLKKVIDLGIDSFIDNFNDMEVYGDGMFHFSGDEYIFRIMDMFETFFCKYILIEINDALMPIIEKGNYDEDNTFNVGEFIKKHGEADKEIYQNVIDLYNSFFEMIKKLYKEIIQDNEINLLDRNCIFEEFYTD